jgi:hypothetical protein
MDTGAGNHRFRRLSARGAHPKAPHTQLICGGEHQGRVTAPGGPGQCAKTSTQMPPCWQRFGLSAQATEGGGGGGAARSHSSPANPARRLPQQRPRTAGRANRARPSLSTANGCDSQFTKTKRRGRDEPAPGPSPPAAAQATRRRDRRVRAGLTHPWCTRTVMGIRERAVGAHESGPNAPLVHSQVACAAPKMLTVPATPPF